MITWHKSPTSSGSRLDETQLKSRSFLSWIIDHNKTTTATTTEESYTSSTCHEGPAKRAVCLPWSWRAAFTAASILQNQWTAPKIDWDVISPYSCWNECSEIFRAPVSSSHEPPHAVPRNGGDVVLIPIPEHVHSCKGTVPCIARIAWCLPFTRFTRVFEASFKKYEYHSTVKTTLRRHRSKKKVRSENSPSFSMMRTKASPLDDTTLTWESCCLAISMKNEKELKI